MGMVFSNYDKGFRMPLSALQVERYNRTASRARLKARGRSVRLYKKNKTR